MYKDKYCMTKQENIYLAKKLLVSAVYSSAKVEGVNVTYPETEAIMAGINVSRLNIDDILVIRNLRNAWKFVLNNLDIPFSVEFICKVNEEAAREDALNYGKLRTGMVHIGGTNWSPAPKTVEQVKSDLKIILEKQSATDMALSYFAYGCSNQLFYDGNKRTSFICANKLLIEAGAGLLVIADNNVVEFNKVLQTYYNALYGKDRTEMNLALKNLKDFWYEKCLLGNEKINSKNNINYER